MAVPSDPFRNPTGLIPRVRTTVITGGAAGDHTLTGITTDDDIISVHAIAAAGTNTAVVTGFAGGAHTVSAGEETAGTLTIASGLTTPDAVNVTIVDTGNNVVTADADVTISTGDIIVADGVTFAVTENYIVYWTAYDASDASLTATITATLAGSDLTSEFSIGSADTINNDGGTASVGDALVIVWYDQDWGEESNASWNG